MSRKGVRSRLRAAPGRFSAQANPDAFSAARLHAPGDLRLENRPRPRCGKGDLLLRVIANAVCGTDVKAFFSGHSLIRRYPIVTGHELVGEVIEVGAEAREFEAAGEVRQFREGMRVVVAPVVACEKCANCQVGRFEACTNREDVGFRYDGGNAQLMLVPEELLRKVVPPVFEAPAGVPAWAAAICEPIACAIHAQLKLHRFGVWDRRAQRYGNIQGIRRGDLVVVIGGGPLGDIHCELARAAGARVVLAQRSAQKLQLGRAMQIADDYVLNAEPGALEKFVAEQTGGDGADIVITACSDPEAQAQALRIARKGGCITLFGSLPGAAGKAEPTIALETNRIHNNGPAIYGTSGASPFHLPIALQMIADGKIRPENYVTHIFGLERLETILRVRGLRDREMFEDALRRRRADEFAFLSDSTHGVNSIADPYERVNAFKGSIMKALCAPWMPGKEVISLTAMRPAERRKLLDGFDWLR